MLGHGDNGSGTQVVSLKTEAEQLNKPRLVTGKSRGLIMLGLVLIYSVCFVAIKAGLAFAPPLYFGGIRALVAGLALLVVLLAVRGPLLPSRQSWPWLLALAATATTITFGGMFLSPGRTGAGIASVLGNTQPFITIVLAALFLAEKITRGKLMVLLAGLIGVGLISAPAWFNADIYSLGGALTALASSTGSAAGNIIVKRMGNQFNLLTITAWQLILGSLPLLAVSAFFEGGAKVSWNLEFIVLLLFLALVGTAFTTGVWYFLVQHSDVGKLTLFLFLVPVFGLGMAAWLLGEAVSLIEIGGVLFIIGGMGIVIWGEIGSNSSKSTVKL